MMNRIFILSFILFSLIFIEKDAFSQSYRSGYIITNQDDTIPGLLKYQKSKKAAQFCYFKKEEKSKVKEYRPFDIKGYRFEEDKYYLSKNVFLFSDTVAVFLEYLIRGTANMYYLHADDEHYFIETERNGMVELTEKERIIHRDDGTYLAPSIYKGKLISSLDDYKGIENRVQKVQLNHQSLIDLAKDYHDVVCDSVQCIIFEKKVKPLKLRFGLLAGVSSDHLNFGNRMVTNQFIVPYFGISFSLTNISVADERFFIQFNAIYKQFSKVTFQNHEDYTDRLELTYNDNIYYLKPESQPGLPESIYPVTSLNVDLKIRAFQFPLIVNYFILTGKVKPYLGIGFNNMLVVSQNENLIYQTFYERYEKTIPSFLLGVSGNLGCYWELKNDIIFLNISASKIRNYNNYTKLWQLMIPEFSVHLGYTF